MKSLLLTASNDARLGFRLAGIESQIISDGQELLAAVDKAIANPDIALILITSEVADSVRQQLLDIKLKTKNTSILLIPEPHSDFSNHIEQYVNQAIGIKG